MTELPEETLKMTDRQDAPEEMIVTSAWTEDLRSVHQDVFVRHRKKQRTESQEEMMFRRNHLVAEQRTLSAMMTISSLSSLILMMINN